MRFPEWEGDCLGSIPRAGCDGASDIARSRSSHTRMDGFADCYAATFLLNLGRYALYVAMFVFGFLSPRTGSVRALLSAFLSLIIGVLIATLTIQLNLECWWYPADHDIPSEKATTSYLVILTALLCTYLGVACRHITRGAQ
jgi:hypothetical protein